MQRTSLALALAALLLACGPIGPCAGGRLDGEVGPAVVSSWAFAEGIETAQLETRPASPHSVHTWFVALGDRLYVPTSMIRGPKSPTKRGWVGHVGDDPRVRIRLGDRIFERHMTRVADADEYDRARRALESKYGLDAERRDPEREVWIFRLDPRAG